jgi:hypothetical protein
VIKAGRTSPSRGKLLEATELYHKAWCIGNLELYRTDRKTIYSKRERVMTVFVRIYVPTNGVVVVVAVVQFNSCIHHLIIWRSSEFST